MKLYHLTVLGLAAMLAACNQKAETGTGAPTNTASAPTAEMAGDTGNMAMPAERGTKAAKGSGTVTAIDKAAGMITLDHGPIPEANWPAMTMAFTAKPALLETVKVGDEVTFDLALKGGAGEVIALVKN